MPNRTHATMHDFAHLSGLIEAARSEADRLGPDLAAAAAHLAQAMAEVQAVSGRGGRLDADGNSQDGERADEGVRLGDLTTENDR